MGTIQISHFVLDLLLMFTFLQTSGEGGRVGRLQERLVTVL